MDRCVPCAWRQQSQRKSFVPTVLGRRVDMAARAIWKGELKLNSTKVPVKLYSAVKDQTVRFHILDEKSKTRVKQHMVQADKGKEVPNEEIQKGFEVEPGTFVILAEEELEKLEPKASREIEITQFLPAKA